MPAMERHYVRYGWSSTALDLKWAMSVRKTIVLRHRLFCRCSRIVCRSLTSESLWALIGLLSLGVRCGVYSGGGLLTIGERHEIGPSFALEFYKVETLSLL